MHGNVRQPELFDAALITDAEIDSFRRAEVRGQSPDENVVLRGHRALDAASGRRGVFTNTQAFLSGPLEKRIAHDHSQGTLTRQPADAFNERDDFAKPRSAPVAVEQMFFDRLFAGLRQRPKPIVGEGCRVDGT
jgi:hypothetical protein